MVHFLAFQSQLQKAKTTLLELIKRPYRDRRPLLLADGTNKRITTVHDIETIKSDYESCGLTITIHLCAYAD